MIYAVDKFVIDLTRMIKKLSFLHLFADLFRKDEQLICT